MGARIGRKNQLALLYFKRKTRTAEKPCSHLRKVSTNSGKPGL
jgi:hypothetical protein